jgi:Protein of unknown function (DUF2793)
MDDTPNLKLPYIMAAQAQKHVTHNDAIRALDAIVQIGVADRDLTMPPASPAEGASYIVATGASGVWSGKDHKIAVWQDGAWAFYAPREGWIAWVADEDVLLAWDGTAWINAAGVAAGAFTDLSDAPASYSSAAGLIAVVNSDETGLEFSDQVPLLGVNTTPDSTNKLAIASEASLFNHAGAGHQHKINKSSAGDTASLLFQTGFSGRAEFGTAGNDDLHLKVSPDGSTWIEAIVVDKDTGNVGIGTNSPSGALSVGSAASVDAYFFYDNANVGDTTDGQSLYVYRRAAEGNQSIRLFVDQGNEAKILSNGNIRFQSTGGVTYLQGSGGVYALSNFVVQPPWESGNLTFRLHGTITAAADQKWAQWQVDDSTDCLHLTRQDTNILGFLIDMPVGIGTTPVCKLDVDGPVRVKSYTVATVPSAAAGAGQTIYVSNESGGAVIAFSDGTNWRRVTDRAVIS